MRASTFGDGLATTVHEVAYAELYEFFDADSGLDELRSAGDGDELWGLLLRSVGGWGHSTRAAEAVELLREVQGSGDLPVSLIAVLLCTCDRWYRCTAKLIASLEGSGLLTEGELDELAEAFLGPEIEIVHPIGLTHPDWSTEFVEEASGKTYTFGPDTSCNARRRPEPPLRRWAAARVLRRDPAQYSELRELARALDDPRHREAVTYGLLDAAEVLEPDTRRELVHHGLRSSQAAVRRRALDRLAELDGHEAAMRRSRRDRNARVQAWKPPASTVVFHAGAEWSDRRPDRVQAKATG
jgi:hypothetical protein